MAYKTGLIQCVLCCEPASCRKLCVKHYRIARLSNNLDAYPKITIEDVLLLRSMQQGDCRVWTGASHPVGYGLLRISKHKLVRVHRYVYEKAYGPIPDGMFVLHRCDVPACFTLEHLWVGSHLDNMRDAVSKGRAKYTGCAKLTTDDVIAIRASHDSQNALARKYGVSQATISSIILRKTWRHI